MKASIFRRAITVVFALYLGMNVAGCGTKIEGKYTEADGSGSIEFKGGKAIFSAEGHSETCDYTVNGDKLTIKSNNATGEDLVFTLMKDGSIQLGNIKFTRGDK